jgi:toxin HigB-1
MIGSFRDKWLDAFFRNNEKGKELPANLEKQLFRRLQMLDDASCDMDLRTPPSNHFEKLSGSLAGRCSMRVNLQWRLIFEFDVASGRAFDVYLDPHSYR